MIAQILKHCGHLERTDYSIPLSYVLFEATASSKNAEAEVHLRRNALLVRFSGEAARLALANIIVVVPNLRNAPCTNGYCIFLVDSKELN